MDTVFAQAVTRISELPLDTQRFIGEALLGGAARPDLPVIEFTDEENAMLDEAEAELVAGKIIGHEETNAFFRELREKAYEAA